MRTQLVVAALTGLVVATGVARGGPERAAAVTATVTVTVSGDGRVQSEPAGPIDCGSRCSAEVEIGATLVLQAVPGSGQALRDWAGGCSGKATTCEVVVEGPTTVSATFAPPQPLPPPTPLNVTRSEGGSVVSDPEGLIDCGSACSAAWTGGGQATVRARAGGGFRFLRWEGACTGSDDACRVTMTAQRDVTAVFMRNPLPPGNYTLVVRNMNPPLSGPTEGTVDVTFNGNTTTCADAECTFPGIAFGTNVILEPSSGTLKEWTGACTGTAERCVLVMGGNAEVTVSFRPSGPAPAFGVNVARSAAEGGEVRSEPGGIDCGTTCAAAFGAKTRVQLRATARAGWSFERWRGDCSGNAGCAVLADTTRSVTAVFRRPRRPLRVELRGRGRGVVRSTPAGISCPPDCSYPFVDGASVELVASNQAGSLFAGWDGACRGAAACTLTVAGDPVARARFDRCATLDFAGFVPKVLRAPRRVRIAVVLTGRASVRVALRRGRAVVKQLRTGRLAPGTRALTLAVPRKAKAGRHTVHVTLSDACGGTKTRTRTVRLR